MRSERRDFHVTGREIMTPARLESKVAEAIDRERQRMGRELHDGVCQTLAGIAALSAALTRMTTDDGNPCIPIRSAEITKLLHGAIEEIRRLSHGLRPGSLLRADLSDALETLATDVGRRFGIACRFRSDGPLPRLPAETEVHLLRVAQEATRNALTHGGAKEIEIFVASTGEQGRLRVRDDGIGLPDRELSSLGIGLTTMACRARLIGGSLELRRRPGRGTEVDCVFPLTTDLEDW